MVPNCAPITCRFPEKLPSTSRVPIPSATKENWPGMTVPKEWTCSELEPGVGKEIARLDLVEIAGDVDGAEIEALQLQAGVAVVRDDRADIHRSHRPATPAGALFCGGGGDADVAAQELLAAIEDIEGGEGAAADRVGAR